MIRLTQWFINPEKVIITEANVRGDYYFLGWLRSCQPISKINNCSNKWLELYNIRLHFTITKQHKWYHSFFYLAKTKHKKNSTMIILTTRNKHLDDYAMIVIRVIQQNSETLMLKELRLVNSNTPFHQNIRFKANVTGISQIYIWVLYSYDTLIIFLLCKIARWS